MTSEELLCAASLKPQSNNVISVPSKELVLEICSNFIVFDAQLDTFRFAHLSVREFLEKRPEYNNSTTSALAAEICLWTILSTSSHLATQELLIKLGWHSNTAQGNLDKFCSYADVYWAQHCKLAKEQRRSGNLHTALKHTLSGGGGFSSCIAQWSERLKRHLNKVQRWNIQMPLEDTITTSKVPEFVALLVACAFDFEEQIEEMVGEAFQFAQCINRQGRGPVLVATKNGSCASLKLLLDQRAAGIQITEEVVKAAAENYSSGEQVMALLLNQRGVDIEITEAVVMADAENYISCEQAMTLLLNQQGVNIQITEAVVIAAAKNFFSGEQIIALLLNQRVNIQITEAVVKAATENSRSGNQIMALLLNQQGANIKITEEVVAAIVGQFDKKVVSLLLNQQGVNIQITEAVVIAAANNFVSGKQIIALLLDQQGVDIEITDAVIESAAVTGQETTLRLFDQWAGTKVVAQHWILIARFCAAAKQGDATAILELIKQGVSADMKDIRGTTPLWHAAARGHTDAVKVLLATNAVDVNVASIANRTPLFWPAARGYSEVVKLLLEHGAKQDYVDVDGKSPLTIAQLRGKTVVVEILIGYNSKMSLEETREL